MKTTTLSVRRSIAVEIPRRPFAVRFEPAVHALYEGDDAWTYVLDCFGKRVTSDAAP